MSIDDDPFGQQFLTSGRLSPYVGVTDQWLRVWRLIEARRRGLPAFRIFNDRTLRALAISRPLTTQELLAVPGVGISTVEKYGADIYRVVRENGD